MWSTIYNTIYTQYAVQYTVQCTVQYEEPYTVQYAVHYTVNTLDHDCNTSGVMLFKYLYVSQNQENKMAIISVIEMHVFDMIQYFS